MKKVLATAFAFSALCAAPAIAADMPVKAPAVPAVVYNWTGAYWGFFGSYNWVRSHWNTNASVFGGCVTAFCEEVNQDFRGFLVGMQSGYRWQTGSIVFGLGWNGGVGRIEGTDPSTCFTVGCPPGTIFPGRHRVTNIRTLYSVYGELGWAFDRWLLAARGGWAGGDVRFDAQNLLAGGFQLESNRFATGWTVGGTIGYLVAENVSFEVGYNYYRLRANDNAEFNTGGVLITCIPCDFHADVHQVVGRVNVKWPGILGLLSGAAPVAAKY